MDATWSRPLFFLALLFASFFHHTLLAFAIDLTLQLTLSSHSYSTDSNAVVGMFIHGRNETLSLLLSSLLSLPHRLISILHLPPFRCSL